MQELQKERQEEEKERGRVWYCEEKSKKEKPWQSNREKKEEEKGKGTYFSFE